MRNVRKAIEEHEERAKKALRLDDFDQVVQMVKDASGADPVSDAVYNGLLAGFAIGYRTAQRDRKKA